jgi:hypothetical protein
LFSAFLLVSVGCSTATTATPPPTPGVRDLTDVAAYAEVRRTDLGQAATDRPDAVERASVTFSAPLTPPEIQTLVESADLRPAYFEWRQVGTELRGGDGWEFLQARTREYPGLRVTYLAGVARLADWAAIADDRRVWLVDLGAQGNLFELAIEAGLLNEP